MSPVNAGGVAEMHERMNERTNNDSQTFVVAADQGSVARFVCEKTLRASRFAYQTTGSNDESRTIQVNAASTGSFPKRGMPSAGKEPAAACLLEGVVDVMLVECPRPC